MRPRLSCPPPHLAHPPPPPTPRSCPRCRGRLFGYQRVHLAPGQSVQLQFTLNATTLGLVDGEGHRWLFSGAYGVEVTNGVAARVASVVTVDVPQPVLLKAFRKFW
jgi:hypothetical protein